MDKYYKVMFNEEINNTLFEIEAILLTDGGDQIENRFNTIEEAESALERTIPHYIHPRRRKDRNPRNQVWQKEVYIRAYYKPDLPYGMGEL